MNAVDEISEEVDRLAVLLERRPDLGDLVHVGTHLRSSTLESA